MGTFIGLFVVGLAGLGFYGFLRFKSPDDADRVKDAMKALVLSIVAAAGVFKDAIAGLF